MVEYSPPLGGLRESIRTALLQVKFQENQMLPQLNIGGAVRRDRYRRHNALHQLSQPRWQSRNCTAAEVPGATGLNGIKLPFGGIYGDALNHMLNAQFYNYAAC